MEVLAKLDLPYITLTPVGIVPPYEKSSAPLLIALIAAIGMAVGLREGSVGFLIYNPNPLGHSAPIRKG